MAEAGSSSVTGRKRRVNRKSSNKSRFEKFSQNARRLMNYFMKMLLFASMYDCYLLSRILSSNVLCNVSGFVRAKLNIYAGVIVSFANERHRYIL